MLLALLLIVVAPLVELYFLIEVGSFIGALPTIALSVLTAITGGYLVRRQGFSTLRRVQASLDRGETPALEIVEGGILLLAGFVLLLPGFVTDALGFLMLVPVLRRRFIALFLARMERHRQALNARSTHGQGPRVIEAADRQPPEPWRDRSALESHRNGLGMPCPPEHAADAARRRCPWWAQNAGDRRNTGWRPARPAT